MNLNLNEGKFVIVKSLVSIPIRDLMNLNLRDSSQRFAAWICFNPY